VPIGGDGGGFIHHPNRRSHKKLFFVEMFKLIIIKTGYTIGVFGVAFSCKEFGNGEWHWSGDRMGI
jgi:hypothetical protein